MLVSGMVTYRRMHRWFDADDLDVLANVGFACSALVTLATVDMHLGRDEVTLFHGRDFISDSRDFAAEFVSRNERRMNAGLSPGVPIENVEICAANGCDFDFDQDFCWAELESYFADLDTRFRLPASLPLPLF